MNMKPYFRVYIILFKGILTYMQKSVFTIFILFSVCVDISIAQYSFENFDYTNGLPLDEVKEIVEDKKGYIWFGGSLGLSRFDGRNFTHYYRGSTKYNVAGNVVNDIKVTPSGKVVAVYDDNGISVYDHHSDSFRTKTYAASDSSSFPQQSIYFVYIENDTSAYLGANKEGLFHINLNTLESKKIPIDYIPHDMHPDPANSQSYFVTGGGLHRLNMSNLNLERLTSLGFTGIDIIKNEVWYSGYGVSVNRYNLNSGKEKKYKINSNGVIRGWTIVDRNLWVATPHGVEVIDTCSAKLVTIMKAGINIHDLQGTFIYKIYKDSKNRIWVSTDGGISLYDPTKSYFDRTPYLVNQSTGLTKLNDADLLSLDFYGNEIYKIKDRSEEIQVQIKSELRGPLEFIRYQNRSLIMFFNGIGEYHENSNAISDFDSPYTQSKTRGLVDLYIDKVKWLGIYRFKNMMLVWNIETNQRDTINFVSEPRGIFSTKDGNVWIHGANLLWKYNLKSGNATEFKWKEEQYSSLGLDILKIDNIAETYWISTKINGIFKATYNGERFNIIKHYTEKDGLINNNVVDTYLDEYDNLFVLCRSNMLIFDKVRNRFVSLGGTNDINFQVAHGVTAFDSTVYVLGFKSKSIDLRNVNLIKPKLNTIIERVQVNGLSDIDFSNTHTNLKYYENNINLSFSTIEFNNPSSIRHRYRIDTMIEWIYLDPGAKNIQLSALAVGDYSFQLSTSNGNGEWSSPLEWSFSIDPPFWKRWWFILFTLSLIAFLAYALYRARMNQLKKLNIMNLKVAELESESLRAQMNPHFIFNALNSIKAYIIKSNKEEAADYLTTFSDLIRAVLRNSKQKEISLKNEIEALKLYLQIENFRLNHKFDYNINISEDINIDRVAFPPLIIQPFVENSIWHGFVNKKTKGKLDINICRMKDQLIIEVIDDGIGREASRKIEKSRGRERSFGIAITENRLNNIMNKTEIKISDLYQENGMSNGTRVEIHVPYKLLENN